MTACFIKPGLSFFFFFTALDGPWARRVCGRWLRVVSNLCAFTACFLKSLSGLTSHYKVTSSLLANECMMLLWATNLIIIRRYTYQAASETRRVE